MGAEGLLEALRPLCRLETLTLRFKGVGDAAKLSDGLTVQALTFPHLPALRELHLAGGFGSDAWVLYVASATLRRLDYSEAGKILPVYLDCPLLQEVRLSRDRCCRFYTSVRCSFAPGETLAADDAYRPLYNAPGYVVGESCRGLYSPEDPGRPLVGSGIRSLWRIPDGVRVTFDAPPYVRGTCYP
jgi:hypothetical protein